MTQKNMEGQLDIIEEGLRLCGLRVLIREETALYFRVNTELNCIDGMMYIGRGGEWLSLRGVCTVRVPKMTRSRVADLIVRTNECHAFGGFDMSFEEGLVFYRNAQMLLGGDPTHKMVEALIGYMLTAWNRVHTPLMAVAYGDMSSADAIAQVSARPIPDSEEQTDSEDDSGSMPDVDIDTVLRQLRLE